MKSWHTSIRSALIWLQQNEKIAYLVSDNFDARMIQIQPVGYLPIGDDVDVPYPGRILGQCP